jgi:hypothetical protein
MELYPWVHELQRLALNVRESVLSITQILGSIKAFLVEIVIFLGFLYGLYRLWRDANL